MIRIEMLGYRPANHMCRVGQKAHWWRRPAIKPVRYKHRQERQLGRQGQEHHCPPVRLPDVPTERERNGAKADQGDTTGNAHACPGTEVAPWSADAPARIQGMGSPGLVIAGRWRAAARPAGGRWPPAGPHRSGAPGQPPRVGECAAEQEFDLGVGAAQLVVGPPGQGVVDGGVQPQQDALAFGHRGSVLVVTGVALTGRGSRC